MLVLYDTLTIYGLTLTSYSTEFIFLISERQNIVKRLNKKIVRTTGVQIATTPALNLMDEFYKESLVSGKAGLEQKTPTEEVIKLSEVDKDLEESN